ncbi:MAG: S8 family serine peptidase, partial [Synechococcales bacterium]|nr:S8 family serine peptidase [Synechococcales bacterium]
MGRGIGARDTRPYEGSLSVMAMVSSKAIFILDPDRRSEQFAILTEQVRSLHPLGDAFWAVVTEEQADRFARRGIVVQMQVGADLVELPAIEFDPDEGEPNPPALFTAALPTGTQTAYYLVQFFAPPESAWMTEIEAIGGRYIQSLPRHLAVFQLTASQLDPVRQLDPVTWVGIYHPAYALSYSLAGQEMPFVVNNLQTLQIDLSTLEATEEGSLEVLFFDDIELNQGRSQITTTGATITAETGYSFILNASASQLAEVLRIPGVRAIEPYSACTIENQKAGVIIAANQVRDLSSPTNFFINLNGAGEIVSILDSGLDNGNLATLHPDLRGRVLQLTNLNGAAVPTGDNAPHGTHVAGSIAGNGTQSGGQIRGVAPACQIIFHAMRPPVGNGINASQFLTGFLTSHQLGARVHSNSWGQTAAASQYSNAVSGIIDQFVFFHPDSLVLFAAGNNERDINNNGVLDMRRLSNQTVAKNILSIGASENVTRTDGDNRTFRQRRPTFYNAATFNAMADAPPIAGDFPISDNANQVAMFSDRGRVVDAALPAARRRIKPDLVAPGTNIISTRPNVAILPAFAPGDFRIPNTAPAADYYISNGTSMATPIAAGAALLTRQYYRTRHGQSRRPLLLELGDQYRDRTAVATHPEGYAIAWIKRDTGANQSHIVAARYQETQRNLGDAPLVRVGDIVQLQANVGDHAVPVLGRQGDRTFLLHQASDNSLRLNCYNRDLTPTASFGTNGIVTISPAARPEADRPPAMIVRGDEIAIVWHQTGSDNLLFHRYRTDTGAAIGTNVTLGIATTSSLQSHLIWTGSHYAIVWVHKDGTTYKLQIRLVNGDGALVGTQPTTLQSQAEAIRDPSVARDAFSVYLL